MGWAGQRHHYLAEVTSAVPSERGGSRPPESCSMPDVGHRVHKALNFAESLIEQISLTYKNIELNKKKISVTVQYSPEP